MTRFTATLQRFAEHGEKTGWTVIEITPDLAEELKPGNRKSFRVKGLIDKYKIAGVALIPIGGGSFVLAVNATMRKAIAKKAGAMVDVQLEEDKKGYLINKEFMECLADEPAALQYFNSLPNGHRNYFSKWIDSAKTEPTKAKKIAQAISALALGWGFSEMVRANKKSSE